MRPERAMSAGCGVLQLALVFLSGNPKAALELFLQDHRKEDHEMLTQDRMLSRLGRATVLATAAAVVLTAVAPSLANAAPVQKSASVTTARGGMTDVSARRRVHHHHYYHGGGGAAAAAAFAGIIGTGLAIAAEQNRRDYYEDHYYYGRPAYYGPGYGYYGGGPYYRGW
jgi:hypothetical protein